MTSSVRIAPSVLSADLGRLAAEVQLLESGGADWIHIDVMDGQFVPNLTFGTPVVAALRRITDLPLDVHLMVLEPEQYIETFVQAGASVFTFHPEATVHVQRHLATIREVGMKAGLALNPSTPLAVAEEVADDGVYVGVMEEAPHERTVTDLRSQKRKEMVQRPVVAQPGAVCPALLGANLPSSVPGREARRCAEAFDLPAQRRA